MAAFQRQTSRLSLSGVVSTTVLATLLLWALPHGASAGPLRGGWGLGSELFVQRLVLRAPIQDSLLDRLVASIENDGGVPVPVLTAAVNSATVGLSALSFRAADIAAGQRFASSTTVMLDFGVGSDSQTLHIGGERAAVALTIEHRFR